MTVPVMVSITRAGSEKIAVSAATANEDCRHHPRKHRPNESMGADAEGPCCVPGDEETILQRINDRPRDRDSVVAPTSQEGEGDRETEIPYPHEERHNPRHPHPVVGNVDREEVLWREIDCEVHRQKDHQRAKIDKLFSTQIVRRQASPQTGPSGRAWLAPSV